MNTIFETITSGTITSPQGFLAGAVSSGIKTQKGLDLAILYSEQSCVAAGVFTTNAIKASPIIFAQKNLENNRAQMFVVNSGCANACTGESGYDDTKKMANLAAAKMGISSNDVLIASTGVIGIRLPMTKIEHGISQITISKQGGKEFAKAIMTTDTGTKEIALSLESDIGKFIIGGVAKGSGMIHPNMATMLCFITTDANVDVDFLQIALQKAVDQSFNMITVDGDTSPSDMAVVLANRLAGNELINKKNGNDFQRALNDVCLFLAKCIIRDGEGSTKLIEVVVKGAYNHMDARLASRTVAGSSLFKAAINGNDPNWGRIVAALGRSGARVNGEKLDLSINNICVMNHGNPVTFNAKNLSHTLADKNNDVEVMIQLNMGKGEATAWGCDLSREYVTINSAYTT